MGHDDHPCPCACSTSSSFWLCGWLVLLDGLIKWQVLLRAAVAARSITNPDRQTQTLATVAEALAARGEMRQARHVASEACAVGRWTMALVPVVEPLAVRVLSDP